MQIIFVITRVLVFTLWRFVCQGSGDSDYSLQSSEISTATDDDPEALRREREVHQKEVEHRALAQLDRARVCCC